jgi:hypothetical protein
MPPELVLDSRRWADEHDAEIRIARRRHRAVDDVSRGVVSAHRVNGNPDHVSRVQGSGFRVQGSFQVRGFGVRACRP